MRNSTTIGSPADVDKIGLTDGDILTWLDGGRKRGRLAHRSQKGWGTFASLTRERHGLIVIQLEWQRGGGEGTLGGHWGGTGSSASRQFVLTVSKLCTAQERKDESISSLVPMLHNSPSTTRVSGRNRSAGDLPLSLYSGPVVLQQLWHGNSADASKMIMGTLRLESCESVAPWMRSEQTHQLAGGCWSKKCSKRTGKTQKKVHKITEIAEIAALYRGLAWIRSRGLGKRGETEGGKSEKRSGHALVGAGPAWAIG